MIETGVTLIETGLTLDDCPLNSSSKIGPGTSKQQVEKKPRTKRGFSDVTRLECKVNVLFFLKLKMFVNLVNTYKTNY